MIASIGGFFAAIVIFLALAVLITIPLFTITWVLIAAAGMKALKKNPAMAAAAKEKGGILAAALLDRVFKR